MGIENEKTGPNDRRIQRRRFLAGTGAAVVAAGSTLKAGETMKGKYRVGVIGHTGRGNYGHGLDRLWRDVPAAEVVAVADTSESGLAAAVRRLGGVKGYADYRKMLSEVQ